jgi:hypothetical protein
MYILVIQNIITFRLDTYRPLVNAGYGSQTDRRAISLHQDPAMS